MSRRRKLSSEERELWNRVAATARAAHPPRDPDITPETATPPRPAPAKVNPIAPPTDLSRLRIGAKPAAKHVKITPAPSLTEHLAAQPVQMDRKAHRSMTRGKLSPDARIDLHGMTQAEAHPELIRFILRSQDHGHRLVLVITGKGKHKDEGWIMPERLGVLRHQVPHWLRQAPLAPVVMQITQAHQRHGGQGAYYVYLRKLR
ncbi:DNA mismatch repair protein MutS [Thioclava sp. SK-1]|uniref:Smr/MutS family protein n=1 Tax=Thioclava sp. SK-1 TaxID=1889770 RepID=UPI0008249F7F|nr:Smr/MutS family protein [Thioclava sp. SK-1]OCX61655.1 DNA mismatch repair protein MutS [Thioclava sp. SK-1]